MSIHSNYYDILRIQALFSFILIIEFFFSISNESSKFLLNFRTKIIFTSTEKFYQKKSKNSIVYSKFENVLAFCLQSLGSVRNHYYTYKYITCATTNLFMSCIPKTVIEWDEPTGAQEAACPPRSLESW